MEKQLGISRWLKGIVVVMAVILILVFGIMTSLQADTYYHDSRVFMWVLIVFTWAKSLLCFGVLIWFWKICTEIGKDNSFSMENVKYFHNMGKCGISLGCLFLGKLIPVVVFGRINWLWICTEIFMAMVCLVFVVLCEALSRLVKNAYEMKSENDLTI